MKLHRNVQNSGKSADRKDFNKTAANAAVQTVDKALLLQGFAIIGTVFLI